MENNAGKEQWIDEVMGSTQSMRAHAGDDMYSKVMLRLRTPVPRISPFTLTKWAAAAILLLAINLASAIHFSANSKKDAGTAQVSPLAAQIQSETTYNY